jgi:hypothetical protein
MYSGQIYIGYFLCNFMLCNMDNIYVMCSLLTDSSYVMSVVISLLDVQIGKNIAEVTDVL